MAKAGDLIGESFGSIMVPDGVYEGTITGRKVTFMRDNTKYLFETLKPVNEDSKVRIVIKMMKGNVYLK